MAKDPSKKGVRKIPPDFVKWIETNYGKDVATWYKKGTGKGKAEATRQRQGMSDLVGQTGAFHEGHFQGAKDFDPDMGGGPTTGRSMRPEIGVGNVSHAEMPRISKRDMKALGIPQFWVEDFYEAVLESEGQKVIGNLDVQGAFEMDRGASAEQAAYNSRTRSDLRAQGVDIPGDRYLGTDSPAPINKLPNETLPSPKFDVDSIKKGTGIPRVTGQSRVAVPKPTPLEMRGGSAKFKGARALPIIGLAAGAWVAGEQALAGDYKAAAGTVVDEVTSEAFLDTQPTASGTLTDAPYQHQVVKDRLANPTVVDKFIQDPVNELHYAGKQVLKLFGGAIRMGSEAGF